MYVQERLAALNIHQLNSRPQLPLHNGGKLERYHRRFTEFCTDHGPADTAETSHKRCDPVPLVLQLQTPHPLPHPADPAVVYAASRKVTPRDLRRGGVQGPRVLTMSESGSVLYRRREINAGMPL